MYLFLDLITVKPPPLLLAEWDVSWFFQGSGQKGEIAGDPIKNGVGRPPQGCLQYILDCNGVAVSPKPVQANWVTQGKRDSRSQSLDNNDLP